MISKEENLKKWENTIREIFDNKQPTSTEWHDSDSIIAVLNKLSSVPGLFHMFYPSGGGMTLDGAKKSVEPGCIELLIEYSADIVKPQKLSFNFFGNDNFEWAYFRLETSGLAPSGVYDKCELQYEELTEIGPGKYIDRSYSDYGYYGYDENGEKPLPKGSRVVSRMFSGDFVFFATASIYNRTSGTYDGRHNEMTSEQFVQYIQKAIDSISK